MTTRAPLPLVKAGDRRVACTECGRCCTYVAVGINDPFTLRRATDVLWYLYHEHVTVYRDGDGEWSVVFETRCRHLAGDLLCGIYTWRPQICRSFSDASCEVNSPGEALSFARPEEFLEYLKRKRPKLYRTVAERFVPPSASSSVSLTPTS